MNLHDSEHWDLTTSVLSISRAAKTRNGVEGGAGSISCASVMATTTLDALFLATIAAASLLPSTVRQADVASRNDKHRLSQSLHRQHTARPLFSERLFRRYQAPYQQFRAPPSRTMYMVRFNSLLFLAPESILLRAQRKDTDCVAFLFAFGCQAHISSRLL